jgi:hypothetical protein
MALLDMQAMELETRRGGHDGHGGHGGSHLSVLLCDSALSTLLCL